jgi:AcrR family transcriptional regulator
MKNAVKNQGRPRSEQCKEDVLKAAFRLLKVKGFRDIGYHEIAKAAGVSSATLYRWWSCKEEILFDTCFSEMKIVVAVSESGSALERLHQYVLRLTDFLISEKGTVMSRVFCGMHDDNKLQKIFIEKYLPPRRKIFGGIIKDAIKSGELKRNTDADLLMDALSGPMFFRWLQRHAPLDRKFVEQIYEKVIPAFKENTARGPRTQRSIVRNIKG